MEGLRLVALTGSDTRWVDGMPTVYEAPGRKRARMMIDTMHFVRTICWKTVERDAGNGHHVLYRGGLLRCCEHKEFSLYGSHGSLADLCSILAAIFGLPILRMIASKGYNGYKGAGL